MITLNKVAALQAESKSALGVDEINALTGAETRNVKVANKIGSFLED